MATGEGLEPPRSSARIKIWCVYQFRHPAIYIHELSVPWEVCRRTTHHTVVFFLGSITGGLYLPLGMDNLRQQSLNYHYLLLLLKSKINYALCCIATEFSRVPFTSLLPWNWARVVYFRLVIILVTILPRLI